MKVSIGKDVYFVHFETRKKLSRTGDKKLAEVTCYVRDVNKRVLYKGGVKQNYHDRCNMVSARKMAFCKTISPVKDDKENIIEQRFNREERVVFWKEFKDKCRYKV